MSPLCLREIIDCGKIVSFSRLLGIAVCFCGLITAGDSVTYAQDDGWNVADSNQISEDAGATWNEAGSDETSPSSDSASGVPSSKAEESSSDSQAFTGPSTTRYSLELSRLPDENGQFWVVYDITPYTDRFPNVSSPQDSIVDWILFDSGEGFWRKEPFSVLSATRERLYVYHSSSVQRYVSNVIDRFIEPDKRGINYSIKIVVLQSPDWRSKVFQYLTPLNSTIVGNGADVQSWLAERSDMNKVVAELAKRTDYVLLNTGKNIVPNGETFGWAAAQPRKTFNRDYRADSTNSAGYSADVSSVDEGFRIEATPLLSTTGETLEMTFRYRSTTVEKTRSFSMRVPTATSPRQQLNVEKPSIVSCDFRGKISAPRSKSAIVDLGLVPLALPKNSEQGGGVIESVSGLISQKTVFYNVLMIVEESE